MSKGRSLSLSSTMARFASRESLISDHYAQTMLLGLLSDAAQVENQEEAWNEVRTEVAESWGFDDPIDSRKPFLYNDGVAIIPVHGILLNRFGYCWGFVTGYDFIRRQMNAALADDDVTLIVFDHDSPGGEAAGCDELAREIFESRSVKPSLAVVNTLSASAGYWLAAPATRIACAPSGSVGSIGVYIQHMNIAKMIEEIGIEVDFVKNGKFKTSGNMFEKMSAESRQYLQDMVDERAGEFHSRVAEFRGVEESLVKGTDARVMRPPEALSLGLIDVSISPAKAVSDYLAEIGGEGDIENEHQEDAMADEPKITDQEKAELRQAEQARIKGIMTSEEAKGREDLANHLAYETENSVEASVAILKVAPAKAEDPAPEEVEEPADKEEVEKPADKEEVEKDESAFNNAMDSGEHPNIGPNGDKSGDAAPNTNLARILGAQAAATGRKVPK